MPSSALEPALAYPHVSPLIRPGMVKVKTIDEAAWEPRRVRLVGTRRLLPGKRTRRRPRMVLFA